MSEETAYQAFIEDAYEEYEQTQRDLKEIDVLIKQSAAEVERLAQRNAQVTAQSRQLQTNFNTLPREYIRETYESLVDVQKRLFTMRGQLEKLQSDQRNLEKLYDFQRRFIELSGESHTSSSTSENGSAAVSGGDISSVIRVIQTEEAAKQSLVREMHDGPASALSNFILQAEICQRAFEADPESAKTELNALKTMAGSTFNDVKNFIFDLRPMMLDDLGVAPTLRRYVESFQDKNGVSALNTITGVERRLESHIEVTIFRGVQELLNNALSHGQASQMQVSLDMAQERVTAVVEDNGNGFDVDAALNNDSANLGLSSLRERVEMLGGELKIQSGMGQGSRAEFYIPVANTELIG